MAVTKDDVVDSGIVVKKSNNNKKKKVSNASSKKQTSAASKKKTPKERLQEEKEHELKLDTQLLEMGLRRKNIPKDGSCLFRACSDLLYNTQFYHNEMRAKTVRFLELNRANYEPYVCETSFTRYCGIMRRSNTWAGQLELEAIAQCFQCNITVYSIRGIETEHTFHNNKQLIGSIERKGPIPDISLCFLHGNHYDAVYPDTFFESAGFCQEIIYNDILGKLWIENATPTTAPVYHGYRNIEYDVYIDELRQQQLQDQELAKKLAEEKKRKEEEEEEASYVQQEPSEIKTVVATGKIIPISYADQLKQEETTDTTTSNEDLDLNEASADLTVTPVVTENSVTEPSKSINYSELAQSGIKQSPPNGWTDISPGTDVIPGTKLIAMRTPLNTRDYSHSINLFDFHSNQAKNGRKIGLFIDLANTRESSFDQRQDIPQEMQVVKLASEADVNFPSENQVDQFIRVVDGFLQSNPDTYIIASCTYGINRTGFFICEYLIRKKGLTVEQALKVFAHGRKLAIYHPMFMDELFRRHNQESSQMFQEFRYPLFPAFVRDTYIRQVRDLKLLEKRGIAFNSFNFNTRPSFDDLTQFQSIHLPSDLESELKKKSTKKKKNNKGKSIPSTKSADQNSTQSALRPTTTKLAPKEQPPVEQSVWASFASNVDLTVASPVVPAKDEKKKQKVKKQPKPVVEDTWVTVKSGRK